LSSLKGPTEPRLARVARERTERQVPQKANPNRTYAKYALGASPRAVTCRDIRGSTQESRHSNAHTRVVRRERVGKTICNNSEQNLYLRMSANVVATGRISRLHYAAARALLLGQPSPLPWKLPGSNHPRHVRRASRKAQQRVLHRPLPQHHPHTSLLLTRPLPRSRHTRRTPCMTQGSTGTRLTLYLRPE